MAKNTKHKQLKHQKEATAGAEERIIHITQVLNKYSGIEVLSTAFEQSKKPKTDKKDDTKWIFIKLPYMKEMNGHIPKEINGFLKKLDFKVTFILINKTLNLKRLFTFKERRNKLHRSGVVYRIICTAKARVLVRLPGI